MCYLPVGMGSSEGRFRSEHGVQIKVLAPRRTCNGKYLTVTLYRVLVRITKMSVQDCNSKISVCPDLATQLLQNLIPTTSNS